MQRHSIKFWTRRPMHLMHQMLSYPVVNLVFKQINFKHDGIIVFLCTTDITNQFESFLVRSQVEQSVKSRIQLISVSN